ncbi:MAG: tetratricopeptide repeat protein [Terracidiphilus sp.]|jgi:tol-pal system protein YbgF
MLTSRKFRIRLLPAVVLGALLVSMPMPAHAASKEIVELQTQVQQLLDMVQRLQSTMDTRFGVLQNLAQQTADNATQMSAAVNALQQKINAQNDAINGRLDTTSGQIQSLNDSVDEMKSRLAKLDKTIQDMQTQLQNIQSPAPAVAPGTPASPPPDGASAPPSAPPAAVSPATSQAPPLQATFQAGVRDYNAARYDVATGEFQAVLQYYPLDDLSGAAEFYLGEIAYHQQDYAAAVKSYNAVLEGFSGSPKAPAAQLRKGLALIQLGKKDSGIHELRALIQRHPQTPEAAQARSKLNGLGVRIAAK